MSFLPVREAELRPFALAVGPADDLKKKDDDCLTATYCMEKQVYEVGNLAAIPIVRRRRTVLLNCTS